MAFLMRRQRTNGDWPQESVTGIFNRSCGITYANYRNIFPVWALGAYCSRYARRDPALVGAAGDRAPLGPPTAALLRGGSRSTGRARALLTSGAEDPEPVSAETPKSTRRRARAGSAKPSSGKRSAGRKRAASRPRA